MLITGEIKKRLREAGVKPNKRLGQNFLINPGIYRKIIEAAFLKSGDMVVEVGPGLGILTELMAATGVKVIAVEKDPSLAEYLKNRYAGNTKIEIINQDILKFNPKSYKLPAKSYKLIGNIPYYLTSHLIKTVFENWPAPEMVIFTVQKEVAQRIVALPPKMSLLAVSVQYFAEAEIVAKVSKGSFLPVPKVDSAIVRLRTKDQRLKPEIETEKFFKIVKAGFAGKRKQLVNNLSAGLGLSKKEVEFRLQSLGIAAKRRAETLTVKEWQKISETMSGS